MTPYWDTVTCELDISGCPKEECIYRLTFSSKDEYKYVSHQYVLLFNCTLCRFTLAHESCHFFFFHSPHHDLE